MYKAARAHDGVSAACVKSKMPLPPVWKRPFLARPSARIALLLCGFSAISFGVIFAQKEPMTEERYEREELGVNSYTAPSIAQIFEQLDRLRPLPFDQLWRELPSAGPGRREQKAMIFGQLVADGFLIVEAQKQNLIDDLGRVLIREARGLGVAERVMKHSASLTELGKNGNWPAVRQELVATQTDVEQAMIDLRDQKMAHLISLGGWLRGLEISSGAVEAKFSPERAALLVQPQLLDYFEEELKTLPPQVAHDPLFDRIRGVLKNIRDITQKSSGRGLQPAEVKSIGEQAHQLNLEIGRPG